MLSRIGLFGVAFGAVLLLGIAAPPAQAQGRGCEQRLDREQWQLQRQINRYGWYSRQAQWQRERIRELRENCGSPFNPFVQNRRRRGDGDHDRDDRRVRRYRWQYRDRDHDHDRD
jgi:hypothetical protein